MSTVPGDSALVPLLDTHQHLIYRDRATYGWSADVPALATGDYTLADYAALTAGQGVAGTLFMEVAVDDRDYQAEARFIADLARDPASGIRGLIPSIRPEVDEGFNEWLEESQALGAVGYRRVLHVAPPGLALDPTFQDNVRRIGAAGKAFDACFYTRQLEDAAALAKECAATTIVIDHLGLEGNSGGGLDAWRDLMTAVADLPNTVCKLSGVTAHLELGAVPLGVLQPYFDHVLETFGPERMLWGSDWPVVNLGAGLPGWIALTRELLAPLSADEAAAIAHRTAARVYGVTLD